MPSFMMPSMASVFGHALHHALNGLIQHGHQDSVGDEAGKIVAGQRRFAHLFGGLNDLLRRFIAGAVAANHFHKGHQRHRIHKMHPDKLSWAARSTGKGRDRNAAGVACQNALCLHDSAQSAKQFGFDGLVFHDGFDDQIAVCKIGQIGAEADAAHDLFGRSA